MTPAEILLALLCLFAGYVAGVLSVLAFLGAAVGKSRFPRH